MTVCLVPCSGRSSAWHLPPLPRTGGRNLYAIGGSARSRALPASSPHADIGRLCRLRHSLAGIAGIDALACPPRIPRSRAPGLGYELDTIAAVVIGGASLSGGVGSMGGTVVGRAHHRRAAQRTQPARRLALRAADRHRLVIAVAVAFDTLSAAATKTGGMRDARARSDSTPENQ